MAPLNEQKREAGAVVGSQYCLEKVAHFTMEGASTSKVWSITNADGQAVYRVPKGVDWCSAERDLVDMDDNTIVFMHQKLSSWSASWTAFSPGNREQPLWTLKKSKFVSVGPQLQIFLASNTEQQVPDYTLTGGWLCKKCTIFLGDQKVAEAVRDASLKNVLTEKSVFSVSVQPRVDTAFILSLIIMMEKLYVNNFINKWSGPPPCYAW